MEYKRKSIQFRLHRLCNIIISQLMLIQFCVNEWQWLPVHNTEKYQPISLNRPLPRLKFNADINSRRNKHVTISVTLITLERVIRLSYK